MTEKAPTAASLTRLALERIEDGGVDDARRLLAQALDVDPRYEPAWLWFAHIAEDPGERKFALQQAVAANPESNARAELTRYQNVDVHVPDELEDIGAPPLPPSIPLPTEDVPQPHGFHLRWDAGILALAAIAVAIALILFSQRERPGTPLYVAVAGGMTGSGAASGQETVQSAQLYFDRLNAGGGINGHPVELLVFDDQNDSEIARQVAQEIVDDERIILVIGHSSSSTSVAASPIYEAAGLPAITSTATADDVTQSPWYFRSVFSNSTQGFLIAAYLQVILDHDRVTVIVGDDDFGTSLADGIVNAFSDSSEQVSQIPFAAAADQVPQSVQETISALQAMEDPGVVVMGCRQNLPLNS